MPGSLTFQKMNISGQPTAGPRDKAPRGREETGRAGQLLGWFTVVRSAAARFVRWVSVSALDSRKGKSPYVSPAPRTSVLPSHVAGQLCLSS